MNIHYTVKGFYPRRPQVAGDKKLKAKYLMRNLLADFEAKKRYIYEKKEYIIFSVLFNIFRYYSFRNRFLNYEGTITRTRVHEYSLHLCRFLSSPAQLARIENKHQVLYEKNAKHFLRQKLRIKRTTNISLSSMSNTILM